MVFYENPYAKLERVVVSLARDYPRTLRQFAPALGGQLGSKLWVLDQLADTLGVERRKVRFVEHHESHAACAFLTSAYADAAVLTVDGVGEQATTALWHGEGSSLRCLGAIDFPHSLGLLYAAFTAYLGFEVNEGEYKVMGLAAYGAPRFRDELAQVLRIDADGSFRLEPRLLRPHDRARRRLLPGAGGAAGPAPAARAAVRSRGQRRRSALRRHRGVAAAGDRGGAAGPGARGAGPHRRDRPLPGGGRGAERRANARLAARPASTGCSCRRRRVTRAARWGRP